MKTDNESGRRWELSWHFFSEEIEADRRSFLVQVVHCQKPPLDKARGHSALQRCTWERQNTQTFIRVGQTKPEIPRYSRWFHFSSWDLSSYLERDFRILAERRVTAISLACQLYRADHQNWPQNLQQLVPDYLPKIPADPFGEVDEAIGFHIDKNGLPNGGDRPLLYFVAHHVKDQEDTPIPREPTYGWYSRLPGSSRVPLRQYRDISRFVPAPSKKTVDH